MEQWRGRNKNVSSHCCFLVILLPPKLRRDLKENNLVGTLPNTLSALSFLRGLYPTSALAFRFLLICTLNSQSSSFQPFDWFSARWNISSGGSHNTVRCTLCVLFLPYCRSLYSNRFTGVIPASWNNLINLRQFYLFDNQLSGTLPSFIGNMLQLENLYPYSAIAILWMC